MYLLVIHNRAAILTLSIRCNKITNIVALLLLASMDLDKAAEHLVAQNRLIKAFLKKYLEKIQDQALSRGIEVLINHKTTNYDVSLLD